MQVVHVVRQFHPAIGGFESVVFELAVRQAISGQNVRVVTLDRLFRSSDTGRLPAYERVAGIEVVRIPFRGSQRYPIAPSVLRHIRDSDIVHVHAIDFFFDYLAWTKPLHGKRLVVSTHGGFFHTAFAARLKRIYFATVTRASLCWYDGVAAVSEVDQAQFSRVRRCGMVCIENGVNTAKFANAGARTPSKALLWIGRFSSNKRLDRLLEFFGALRQRDPAWRLIVAGQPWDSKIEDVQNLATQAGVGEALTLVPRPTDDVLCELMGQCSVIASASDYEGFGLVAIEGMSAGLYPVLSNIEPFRRLVGQAGLGLVVDFSDPATAASSFLQHWNDEVATSYADVRSRAMAAASLYGWDDVARHYQALYDRVLGERSRTILNVPVFVGTKIDAVARIDAEYAAGRQTMVAFANAHTLNVASGNAAFSSVLKQFLVMNDGVGVDAASHILFGSRFPQNLNGTDFTPYYFQHTRHSYRIFFIGSSSGVAERAAKRLVAMCGGRHQIAGCQNGYSRAGDAIGIIAKIVASDADVVLVAMGNPLQEFWLARHLQASGCKLGFGVGALFDFLAGEVTRAPDWVRAARVEWVYRLAKEPSRLWRRYILGNPLFLMRVLGQWWSGARV